MPQAQIKLESTGAPVKVKAAGESIVLAVGGKGAVLSFAEAQRLANFIRVHSGPASRLLASDKEA